MGDDIHILPAPQWDGASGGLDAQRGGRQQVGVRAGFSQSPKRFVFDSGKALSDDSILWGRNALSA